MFTSFTVEHANIQTFAEKLLKHKPSAADVEDSHVQQINEAPDGDEE